MKIKKSIINWILIIFFFFTFLSDGFASDSDEWPELFSGKDDDIVFTFDYETSRRRWEETYELTDIDGLKHSEEALNVLRLWYYRGSGEYRYD